MLLANYLFFEKQAAEAFDFYAKCLGGKVAMKITFGEMPGCENLPAEMRNLIAHVRLEAGDAILMASDWCPPAGEPYPGIHGNAVSLFVDTPAEAERLFAALSAGGNVTMPIAETAWALRFGMLTDRYGANWMVNCNRPETSHAQTHIDMPDAVKRADFGIDARKALGMAVQVNMQTRIEAMQDQ